MAYRRRVLTGKLDTLPTDSYWELTEGVRRDNMQASGENDYANGHATNQNGASKPDNVSH